MRIGKAKLVDPDAVPSIIGTSVLAFTGAVEKVHGGAVVEAARARLDEDERREIDATTPITWVRATTMTSWVAALAVAAGTSTHDIVEECARLATVDSFTTVWRVFLRLTSAEALVARTPLIYSRTRNVGQLAVESQTKGQARLRLTGWPGATDGQLHSLAVSMRTILELSGRKSATSRHERSADGGVFELRWTE